MTSEEIFNKLRDMLPNLDWELSDKDPDVHYIQGVYSGATESDPYLVVKATHWIEPGHKELLDVRVNLEILDATPEEGTAFVAIVQKLLSPTRAE